MLSSRLHRTGRSFSFLVITCLLLVAMLYSPAALAAPDADLSQTRAAAEHGFVHQQVVLGEAYFNGNGVPQDLKLAAYWYEKAAGSGDPLAMNQLGYFYQTGIGVAADPSRAVHWYQLAASSGLLRAKINLGVAYLFGSGVPRNPQMAEHLFDEAAKAGDATACAYLGDMYYFGVGVQTDKSAAQRWYEKGARLHDYLAEFRMAFFLSEPTAAPRDMRRALSLFSASASKGYVPAMYGEGLLMLNHPELGGSLDEAVRLINAAAEAGIWKSSLVLGVLARDGRGQPKDDRLAYYHFRVAVAEGGDPARAVLSQDLAALSQRLTAEQRQSADTEAQNWADKHRTPLQLISTGKESWARGSASALSSPVDGAHAGTLIPDMHTRTVIPDLNLKGRTAVR